MRALTIRAAPNIKPAKDRSISERVVESHEYRNINNDGAADRPVRDKTYLAREDARQKAVLQLEPVTVPLERSFTGNLEWVKYQRDDYFDRMVSKTNRVDYDFERNWTNILFGMLGRKGLEHLYGATEDVAERDEVAIDENLLKLVLQPARELAVRFELVRRAFGALLVVAGVGTTPFRPADQKYMDITLKVVASCMLWTHVEELKECYKDEDDDELKRGIDDVLKKREEEKPEERPPNIIYQFLAHSFGVKSGTWISRFMAAAQVHYAIKEICPAMLFMINHGLARKFKETSEAWILF